METTHTVNRLIDCFFLIVNGLIYIPIFLSNLHLLCLLESANANTDVTINKYHHLPCLAFAKVRNSVGASRSHKQINVPVRVNGEIVLTSRWERTN